MNKPTVTVKQEQGKYQCYRAGKRGKPINVGWGWCLAAVIVTWESKGYRVVMG